MPSLWEVGGFGVVYLRRCVSEEEDPWKEEEEKKGNVGDTAEQRRSIFIMLACFILFCFFFVIDPLLDFVVIFLRELKNALCSESKKGGGEGVYAPPDALPRESNSQCFRPFLTLFPHQTDRVVEVKRVGGGRGVIFFNQYEILFNRKGGIFLIKGTPPTFPPQESFFRLLGG